MFITDPPACMRLLLEGLVNAQGVNILFFSMSFLLWNQKKSKIPTYRWKPLSCASFQVYQDEIGKPYNHFTPFLKAVVSFCFENKTLTPSIPSGCIGWMQDILFIIKHIQVHSGCKLYCIKKEHLPSAYPNEISWRKIQHSVTKGMWVSQPAN